jgi:uncharacterized phage protein (TIGR02218 family)
MTGVQAHLDTGATTLARAWAVTRADGVVLGFTDHDRDLEFEGIVFRAASGMTARALAQTTGLSVDNSEALGALRDAGLREADIAAGRYDGAEVRIWLVNWADVAMRALEFRGTLGEVTRAGGAFRAELRGLTEALGQPLGRVYRAGCAAVLGDDACGFDLQQPGYHAEVPAETIEGAVFRFAALPGFDDRWFEGGRIEVLGGAAAGLAGVVKNDRLSAAGRVIETWQALGAPVMPGDLLRITAGCDKRASSCRLKFDNLLNFRGFPDIPGDDWLMAHPRQGGLNDGGSLKR